jgi:hypothetical protein
VIDAIERAMAKDPAQRWASAEAFGLALQQAEITLGLPITPMTVIGPDRVVPRPAVEEEAPAEAAPPPPAKSRAPVVIGVLALLVVAGLVGFLVLGGDDDDDAGDDRAPVTRAEAPDVDLTTVSDDSGTINVDVLERWDDVDGRPLGEDPDVVAAEDADGFLQAEGFGISGIEVTLVGAADDAQVLLDDRVLGRGLNDECTTDLAPEAREVAGFAGLQQRFEGCDGSALVVFAGVAGGQGLVAEVHLVEQEDEDALDAVLESIAIS